MRPQFQQRHFDYVLGPPTTMNPQGDARLIDVAPGQIVAGIELHTDVDAPFLLRGRAYRVQYSDFERQLQAGLESVALRYAGPDLNYFMQGFIPQNLQMPYGGQGGAWKPVSPQVLYPAGSTLTVDILNAGSTHLLNLTLYWRGVKLYNWGSNPAYTYPARMKLVPFSYPIALISQANPFGMIQALGVTEQRLRQPFRVLTDADFVLRYGQAGPSFAPLGLEVSMMLRDENEKAYSNDFVHTDLLFGPSQGNYSTGGATIHAIGTGNALPSVFFPELYIPAGHQWYYDIQRADGGFAGAASIPNYPVTLVGSKVYPQ
jgi:hypothetical protein